MTDTSFDSDAFRAGLRASIPLATPALPFGLVLGFEITDSDLVGNLAGWSSSWLVLAGSAQLVAIDLLSENAAALLIIVTIVMINARHIMYSAALVPRFEGAPRWFRVIGSYLLIDQAFALASLQPDDQSLRTKMWNHLGVGFSFWAVWNICVAAGLAIGQFVPESWALDFAVPLLFGGLLLLAVQDKPGVLAAVVAGTTALLARDFPPGTGLLLAIVLGVAAGGMADRATSNGGST